MRDATAFAPFYSAVGFGAPSPRSPRSVHTRPRPLALSQTEAVELKARLETRAWAANPPVHTPHLSVFAPGRPLPPHSEYSSPSQHGDLPCVCAREPKLWWVREPGFTVEAKKHVAELCRCVHCGVACPAGYGRDAGVQG